MLRYSLLGRSLTKEVKAMGLSQVEHQNGGRAAPNCSDDEVLMLKQNLEAAAQKLSVGRKYHWDYEAGERAFKLYYKPDASDERLFLTIRLAYNERSEDVAFISSPLPAIPRDAAALLLQELPCKIRFDGVVSG